MLLAVAVVGGAGLWDAQQQSQAAIQNLMREERLLAAALAANMSHGLDSPAAPALEREAAVSRVLVQARALEEEGQLAVLLLRRERGGFSATDGRVIANDVLAKALDGHAAGIVLSRDTAASLGLPRRLAVAGLADVPGDSSLGVAVVRSARAERDRSRREEWRTVLSLALVVLLVGGFGGAALYEERRELELERRLAVSSSERERDAQLARANRMAAIAALSTGIAHEVATPLGVIAGRVEQLEASLRGNERAERAVHAISAQVERIDRVMRGFLGLARGEAPILTRIRAKVLVEDAAKLVAHRFHQAGIALRVDVVSADGAETAEVACEVWLFEQVLVNLLINALEASPSVASVEIRLQTANNHVDFVVTDEGAGISPGVIARATEPFFTTKATGGGTGLGLAVAKEIVEHHQGTIALERRADRDSGSATGTRAIVRLPKIEGDKADKADKTGRRSDVS